VELSFPSSNLFLQAAGALTAGCLSIVPLERFLKRVLIV
jgi:hypothetical protein